MRHPPFLNFAPTPFRFTLETPLRSEASLLLEEPVRTFEEVANFIEDRSFSLVSRSGRRRTRCWAKTRQKLGSRSMKRVTDCYMVESDCSVGRNAWIVTSLPYQFTRRRRASSGQLSPRRVQDVDITVVLFSDRLSKAKEKDS